MTIFPVKGWANEQQGEGWAPTSIHRCFFPNDKLRRTCAERIPEILVCRMPSFRPPMSGWFSTVERRSKKLRMWLSPGGGLRRIWKTSEVFTPKWWLVWWLLDMFCCIFRGSFQHFKFTLKRQMIQIYQFEWLFFQLSGSIFQLVMLVFRGLMRGYCTTIVYYRSKFFHLDNGNRRVAKNRWEVEFLLQWTLRL